MNIKIEATDKHLSSFGGLNIFNLFWGRLKNQINWQQHLPNHPKAEKKFEDLLLGFATDTQCLDDMSDRGLDEGFQAVCDNQVYTPKSYGNFLRSFSSLNIDELNKQMALSSFISRTAIKPKQDSMILDFDSTSNQQFAKKMEGVCYSGEKKFDCLTTMHVFDELGLQYYADVRSGTTHTSDKISKIIHMIMSQIPQKGSYAAESMNFPWDTKAYKKEFKVFARGDSGYCNFEFMNACYAKKMPFVARMTANMLDPNIKNIKNWKPTKSKTEKKNCRDGSSKIIDKKIRFYDDRECEVGSTLYSSPKLAKIARIVCIRAKKKGMLGIAEDQYDYFAFISSIGEHEMNDEKLIRFYRLRGQAENYIREMKNGFDTHHYPCLKLDANRAYAVIAAYAYNVMRFISLVDSKDKPQYAKALRHKLIFLPCQVVRHGREVVFKFMHHHFRRMKHWQQKLKTIQFGFT